LLDSRLEGGNSLVDELQIVSDDMKRDTYSRLLQVLAEAHTRGEITLVEILLIKSACKRKLDPGARV